MDLLQHFLSCNKPLRSQYNAQFSQGLSGGYTLKARQIGPFQHVYGTKSLTLSTTVNWCNTQASSVPG